MIRFLDVTCLDSEAKEDDLRALCQLIQQAPSLPAAICVYPMHVAFVKNALQDLPLGFATVINFPSGTLPLEYIILQITEVLQKGATELDIVFPYAAFLQDNDLAKAKHFITSCRQHMGEQTVFKLILETGAIEDLDAIYDLSKLGCEAGVDFIKTSTGKIAKGATLEATASILRAILDYQMQHKRPVGLKVSGGIKTLEQAELFYQQVTDALSEKGRMTPQLFRIGASQLFKTIAFAKA
jgi:deoxyribose-phosphate aldolase